MGPMQYDLLYRKSTCSALMGHEQASAYVLDFASRQSKTRMRVLQYISTVYKSIINKLTLKLFYQ
jgi:hypothetical protein